jgi:general stress protein 26
MEQDQAIKLSLELMETSTAAYLTTIDTKGFPRTRAMLNLRNKKQYPSLLKLFQSHDKDFIVYFTTNTSSTKVKQIEKNQKVCVYYCKQEQWSGLMLNGNIEIIKDKGLKEKLWQKDWDMYYPGGVTDPDYSILCLKPSFVKGYHKFEQYELDLPE